VLVERSARAAKRLLARWRRFIRHRAIIDARAERSAPHGGVMTRCPECESDLELDGYELDVGEHINCPECSIELKVVSTEPTKVSLADAEA
jgi:lysine biosynthesis protein LysW